MIIRKRLTPEQVAEELRRSNRICYDESGTLVSVEDDLYRLEDCGEYVLIPKELQNEKRGKLEKTD